MSRQVIVLFNKIAGEKINHDAALSLVWHVLNHSSDKGFITQLHDNKQIKPFTWSFSDGVKECSIRFSSIMEDITDRFIDGAKKLGVNAFMTSGGGVFQVTGVFPIHDLEHIGDSILLSSSPDSGISVSSGINGKRHFLLFEKERKAWVKRVENNLIHRAEVFFGVKNPKVSVKVLKVHGYEAVLFKNFKLPVQYAFLKVSGSKEVLETALYGGVGNNTGSGFGLVVPA